jgi:hypothetical protein
MNRLIVITLCAALAGCATGAGTEPPPARCMLPPKPLTDIKPGEDIIQKHAELRRDYGRETGKLRCMQSYSKALLAK